MDSRRRRMIHQRRSRRRRGPRARGSWSPVRRCCTFVAPSPPSSPGTDRYGDDDHGNDDGDRRGERGLRGRRGPGAATPSGSGGPLRGRRRNPVVKQRRVYLRDLDGCESRGDAVRRRRGREGCLGIFRGEGQQRAEDRVGVSCRVGGDGVSHDHAVREAPPRSRSDDYAHARRVFDSGAGGDRIDEHGLVSLRHCEAQTGERHVSRHRSDRRRDRRPRRRVGRQGSYRRRRHRLRRGPGRRLRATGAPGPAPNRTRAARGRGARCRGRTP